MYALLNIGSLVLGLIAWALPIASIAARRKPAPFCAASFALCSICLIFQILYNQHLVEIRDWAAIEDTHYAVVFAALLLLTVAAVLNILTFVIAKLYNH